jgi:hypothetical protein
MTTLLAARGQDFAAPFGFHSGAEAMGLMAPAHFGLKGAFGQRCSSERPLISYPECAIQGLPSQTPPIRTSKTFSVSDRPNPVKATAR